MIYVMNYQIRPLRIWQVMIMKSELHVLVSSTSMNLEFLLIRPVKVANSLQT